MTESADGDSMMGAGSMTTMAFSERDLAKGVTNWMLTNFRTQLTDAVRSTPFSVPLLCAIACREAGSFWLPLTPRKSAAEILSLCVYDASGDVANAPRSAFPINTAQFRLSYGDDFTTMLIDEANKARAARGLAPKAIVYKGYGIFQYDLQHVRTDEAFFRSKLWYNFSECIARTVAELREKYEATGAIQEAVRAYNGSGPKADQYARDVMRLLPFCEEAAGSALTPAMFRPAAVVAAAAPVDLAHDDDPGYPADGEISDTADLDTARILANLGAPGAAAPAAPLAAFTTLPFDIARAQAFLDACRTSTPRVTYGLGKKVPFLGAVPGKDFRQVDCSGFVREAIRLSTSPPAPFPDGSVVQHEWIREHGFEKATIADGKLNDGVVRIAFLRPQDSAHGIGHVVLISRAKTLESHSGVGPDARPWDGSDWQAKAFVYVLARGAQLAMAANIGRIAKAEAPVASFALRQGRRYRAAILPSGLEQFASNDLIANKLTQVGFAHVVVTGSGGTRLAEGTWNEADTTVQLDGHLRGVVELPPGAVSDLSPAAVAAPAVVGKAQGNISANLFSMQSLPVSSADTVLSDGSWVAFDSAPFPADKPPGNRVLVSIPLGFKPAEPFVITLFLHGNNVDPPCTQLEQIHKIPFQVREAAANSVLLAPQFGPRSEPGKFAQPGALATFIAEASRKVADILSGNGKTLHEVEQARQYLAATAPIVIASFSGGCHSLGYLLDNETDETSRLSGVVLLDSLYNQRPEDSLIAWLKRAFRRSWLVSLYLTTTERNENVIRSLSAAGIPFSRSNDWSMNMRTLAPGTIAFSPATSSHCDIPTVGPPLLPVKAVLDRLDVGYAKAPTLPNA